MFTTGGVVASCTPIDGSKIQDFKHEVGEKDLELSYFLPL